MQGHFHRDYLFWDAATDAAPELLRGHLELLVHLAAAVVPHGDLRCDVIGQFVEGAASVRFHRAKASASLWRNGETFTGF